MVAAASVLDILLNIGLSVALVSRYGLIGVALGTALPYAVLNVAVLVPIACRTLNVPLRRFAAVVITPSLVALLPAVAVAVLLRSTTTPTSFVIVLGECAVVGVVYVAAFCGFGLRPADRARYVGAVRRADNRRHSASGDTPSYERSVIQCQPRTSAHTLQDMYEARWQAALAPRTGDIRRELASEAAEYLGLSFEETLQRIEQSATDFPDEWNRMVTDPSDPEQVVRFYNESKAELFEQIAWHASEPIHHRSLVCADLVSTLARPGVSRLWLRDRIERPDLRAGRLSRHAGRRRRSAPEFCQVATGAARDPGPDHRSET